MRVANRVKSTDLSRDLGKQFWLEIESVLLKGERGRASEVIETLFCPCHIQYITYIGSQNLKFVNNWGHFLTATRSNYVSARDNSSKGHFYCFFVTDSDGLILNLAKSRGKSHKRITNRRLLKTVSQLPWLIDEITYTIPHNNNNHIPSAYSCLRQLCRFLLPDSQKHAKRCSQCFPTWCKYLWMEQPHICVARTRARLTLAKDRLSIVLLGHCRQKTGRRSRSPVNYGQ